MRRIAYVASHMARSPPRVDDLPHGFAEVTLVSSGQEHPNAVGCELDCNGASDALSTSGDESDTPGELVIDAHAAS
jgi:hypothetical protein